MGLDRRQQPLDQRRQLRRRLGGQLRDRFRLLGRLPERRAAGYLADGDYSARVDLNQRTTLQLDTRYRPLTFLTLIGSWNTWLEDRDLGDVNTLNQRYGIVYSPGTKLSLSGFHQDFNTEGGNRTTTTGTGLSYRLNRHFRRFHFHDSFSA